jgi:hypothetical protein
VVLYNEVHRNGEMVGEMAEKDLVGGSKGKGRSGADLLLVVGTSLRVPGTKRIVREFAKAVRSRSSHNSGLMTPTQSPRRSPAADVEPPISSVYLNLDFPVPTREWEGVFDVWLQGDAQCFAEMLQVEIKKEEKIRELAVERKRKRSEDVAAAAAAMATEVDQVDGETIIVPPTPPKSVRKRKSGSSQLNDESPRRKKTKASKSLTTPQKNRLVIRIPPRPERSYATPRKYFVPDVYIKSPPPPQKKAITSTLPPTPMQTPQRSLVSPTDTITRNIAVDPDDDTSELSDASRSSSDELPIYRVRNVQYGLHGTWEGILAFTGT